MQSKQAGPEAERAPDVPSPVEPNTADKGLSLTSKEFGDLSQILKQGSSLQAFGATIGTPDPTI